MLKMGEYEARSCCVAGRDKRTCAFGRARVTAVVRGALSFCARFRSFAEVVEGGTAPLFVQHTGKLSRTVLGVRGISGVSNFKDWAR